MPTDSNELFEGWVTMCQYDYTAFSFENSSRAFDCEKDPTDREVDLSIAL